MDDYTFDSALVKIPPHYFNVRAWEHWDVSRGDTQEETWDVCEVFPLGHVESEGMNT